MTKIFSRIVDETLGDLARVTRIEGEIVEYERSSSSNNSGLCCFVRRNINRIQNYFESTD